MRAVADLERLEETLVIMRYANTMRRLAESDADSLARRKYGSRTGRNNPPSLGEHLLNLPIDLIADRADGFQAEPGGIGKPPVGVALADLAARLDGLGEPAAEVIVQAC